MYHNRNNQMELLGLFRGNYKKQIYLRMISKLSDTPLKTTQDTLSFLGEERIIKSKVEGRNKYFSLNIENILTKQYLLQTECYFTNKFLKKYPNFKTFLKEIDTDTTLIIFGSFAKFTANKDSDVDILIISKDKIKLPSHLLANKIHNINISEESFKKAMEQNEPLIKELMENHVILNNHSFFINTLWGYYGN